MEQQSRSKKAEESQVGSTPAKELCLTLTRKVEKDLMGYPLNRTVAKLAAVGCLPEVVLEEVLVGSHTVLLS